MPACQRCSGTRCPIMWRSTPTGSPCRQGTKQAQHTLPAATLTAATLTAATLATSTYDVGTLNPGSVPGCATPSLAVLHLTPVQWRERLHRMLSGCPACACTALPTAGAGRGDSHRGASS